ncbi:MAG: extracellular solute-binding protein [Ectothiorhodospiraceae bacterium]|nr:extracellular solute-binding protein [Ectothiorhodospiraceae bacterium]
MTTRHAPKVGRRNLLKAGAALTTAAMFGHAPAVLAKKKPFEGTSIAVNTWSAPYCQWLKDYLPEFEEQTGIKVRYEAAGFPVYNQRMDLELSTGGSGYDVANITFIYVGRWLGAEWFHPLDEFLADPDKTPPDWGADDFMPGPAGILKTGGHTYGLPWICDIYMAAAPRFDLVQDAGLGMPKTLDDIKALCKAVHNREPGVAAMVTENHHGWTFQPYLQSFGGNSFVGGNPYDFTPALDTKEAIEAAEYYADIIRNYCPDGVLSYNYDQTLNACMQGKVAYITFNQAWLVQLAAQNSKVAEKVAYSLFPTGRAGWKPGVATHGWGIPKFSKKKEAAWEFIKWSMSKDMFRRMLLEKGYGSVTRNSVIETPDFRKKFMINDYDVGDMYVKTADSLTDGHMEYRTKHVYPQIDKQLNIAIERCGSGEMTAKEAMQKAQAAAVKELKRMGIKL